MNARPLPKIVDGSDVPRLVLGKYEISHSIAHGGQAEIFVGSQLTPEGLRRRVAIKRILPDVGRDPSGREMFLDEARLAMRFVHPNIAHTYDCGIEDDFCYLVLEYVDGLSLRELQRDGYAPPVGVALRIVADAASALGHAHAATDDSGVPLNVVHRDVSPHNILIARNGTIKLIDFGIAKAQGQQHITKAGTVRGKFRYMAPEQLASSRVDGRADTYALSVVLWELLAGQPFSRAATFGEAVERSRDAIPSIQVVRPDIDGELAAIAYRGLDFDPLGRWDAAADLEQALEQYISVRGLVASRLHVAEWVQAALDETERKNSAALTSCSKLQFSAPITKSVAPTPSANSAAPVAALEMPDGPTSPSLDKWTGSTDHALDTSSLVATLRRLPTGRYLRRFGPVALGSALVVAAVAFATALGHHCPGNERRALQAEPLAVPATSAATPSSSTPSTLPLSDRERMLEQTTPSPEPSARSPEAREPTLEVASSTQSDHATSDPAPPAPVRGTGLRRRGPARQRVGQVSIDTQPRSRVFFRGRLLGRTPLRNTVLPAGRQLLTFERDDGTRIARVVDVRHDRPTHESYSLR